MPNLRVLLIIDDASIGGGQMHVYLLAKYLLKNNEIAIATEPKGWLVDQAKALEIPTYPIAISNKLSLKSFQTIYEILKSQKFDVIHTHGGTAGFWARLAALRLQNKPKIIHTYHGLHYLNSIHSNSSSFQTQVKRFIFQKIDQALVNITDHIICVCQSDYEKAITAKVALSHKTSIVYNGIELNEFTSPINRETARHILGVEANEFIFGNVGRLHQQKGHEYLLKSFSKISNHALLLIIGDGELRDSLVKLAKQLNISNRVVFLGMRSNILEFLSAIDVFVLPSLWEGQPIALLEALAMGKPCIVSDVDGIPEIIVNHKNGYLVQPKDIDGLVRAMNSIIDNPETLQDFSKWGISTISEKFLAQNMAEAIEKIYI